MPMNQEPPIPAATLWPPPLQPGGDAAWLWDGNGDAQAVAGVHLAAEGLEDSEDDGPPLRDMIRRTMNSVLNKSQQEYAKARMPGMESILSQQQQARTHRVASGHRLNNQQYGLDPRLQSTWPQPWPRPPQWHDSERPASAYDSHSWQQQAHGGPGHWDSAGPYCHTTSSPRKAQSQAHMWHEQSSNRTRSPPVPEASCYISSDTGVPDGGPSEGVSEPSTDCHSSQPVCVAPAPAPAAQPPPQPQFLLMPPPPSPSNTEPAQKPVPCAAPASQPEPLQRQWHVRPPVAGHGTSNTGHNPSTQARSQLQPPLAAPAALTPLSRLPAAASPNFSMGPQHSWRCPTEQPQPTSVVAQHEPHISLQARPAAPAANQAGTEQWGRGEEHSMCEAVSALSMPNPRRKQYKRKQAAGTQVPAPLPTPAQGSQQHAASSCPPLPPAGKPRTRNRGAPVTASVAASVATAVTDAAILAAGEGMNPSHSGGVVTDGSLSQSLLASTGPSQPPTSQSMPESESAIVVGARARRGGRASWIDWLQCPDVNGNPRYRNVQWVASRERYRAVLYHAGARRHLGYFMQPEAAARTADLAHIELLRSSGGGGGQVELNFTEEDYEKGSESLQAVLRFIANDKNAASRLAGRKPHIMLATPSLPLPSFLLGLKPVQLKRAGSNAAGSRLRRCGGQTSGLALPVPNPLDVLAMAQAMAPWQSSGLMQGIVPPPDEPIGVGPGPKGWAGFLDQMLAPGSGGLKMNAVTTAATAAVAAAGGTAMCGHAVQDSRSISTEAAAEATALVISKAVAAAASAMQDEAPAKQQRSSLLLEPPSPTPLAASPALAAVVEALVQAQASGSGSHQASQASPTDRTGAGLEGQQGQGQQRQGLCHNRQDSIASLGHGGQARGVNNSMFSSQTTGGMGSMGGMCSMGSMGSSLAPMHGSSQLGSGGALLPPPQPPSPPPSRDPSYAQLHGLHGMLAPQQSLPMPLPLPLGQQHQQQHGQGGGPGMDCMPMLDSIPDSSLPMNDSLLDAVAAAMAQDGGLPPSDSLQADMARGNELTAAAQAQAASHAVGVGMLYCPGSLRSSEGTVTEAGSMQQGGSMQHGGSMQRAGSLQHGGVDPMQPEGGYLAQLNSPGDHTGVEFAHRPASHGSHGLHGSTQRHPNHHSLATLGSEQRTHAHHPHHYSLATQASVAQTLNLQPMQPINLEMQQLHAHFNGQQQQWGAGQHPSSGPAANSMQPMQHSRPASRLGPDGQDSLGLSNLMLPSLNLPGLDEEGGLGGAGMGGGGMGEGVDALGMPQAPSLDLAVDLQTPSLPLSFSMEADLAATASMQPMQHAAQYCVPHIQGSTAVGAQSSSHTHPTLGMPPQAYHSSGMQQGSGQQYPHPMQAGSGGYKPTQAGSGGYKPTQAGSGGYPTQAGIGGYMPHQSHGGSAGAPCPPPQLQPLGRTSFRAHFEGTHYSQYATGPTGPMQPMQGSEGGQRQQRGMQEGPQPVAGLVRLADWQGVYLNTKNNKFRAYSTQSVPDGSRNKCKCKIGEFNTEAEAAHAYDAFMLATHGVTALTNFPPTETIYQQVVAPLPPHVTQYLQQPVQPMGDIQHSQSMPQLHQLQNQQGQGQGYSYGMHGAGGEGPYQPQHMYNQGQQQHQQQLSQGGQGGQQGQGGYGQPLAYGHGDHLAPQPNNQLLTDNSQQPAVGGWPNLQPQKPHMEWQPDPDELGGLGQQGVSGEVPVWQRDGMDMQRESDLLGFLDAALWQAGRGAHSIADCV